MEDNKIRGKVVEESEAAEERGEKLQCDDK
jgi:hypothetical protein